MAVAYRQDSFGTIITDTAPFDFAGGLHDPATGLIRFGCRDYDPDIGRWTAKDPILFAGGDTDLYGYCVNDPVNWVDPRGLSSEGEVINWGIFVVAYIAREGALLTRNVAFHLTQLGTVLGFLIYPDSLNAQEDIELEHWKTMKELEEIDIQIKSLQKRLTPMLEKLNMKHESFGINPCE